MTTKKSNCVAEDTMVCVIDDNDNIFHTTIKKLVEPSQNEKKMVYHTIRNKLTNTVHYTSHLTNDKEDGYIGGKTSKQEIEQYNPEIFEIQERTPTLGRKEYGISRDRTFKPVLRNLYKTPQQISARIKQEGKVGKSFRHIIIAEGMIFHSFSELKEWLPSVKNHDDVIRLCGDPSSNFKFASQEVQESAERVFRGESEMLDFSFYKARKEYKAFNESHGFKQFLGKEVSDGDMRLALTNHNKRIYTKELGRGWKWL